MSVILPLSEVLLIESILIALFRKFKDAYVKFLMRHLLAALLPEIKEAVVFVVTRLDEKTLLNEDKHRYAFQILKQHCKERAKEIPDRFLNLAIELAVSLLKAERKALLERLKPQEDATLS